MSFFAKDYASYFKLAELLSLVDLSLTVKLGVQYSLWGGSVINLVRAVRGRYGGGTVVVRCSAAGRLMGWRSLWMRWPGTAAAAAQQRSAGAAAAA